MWVIVTVRSFPHPKKWAGVAPQMVGKEPLCEQDQDPLGHFHCERNLSRCLWGIGSEG